MEDPQVNHARDRARAQVQDYVRRGLAQGSSEASDFAVEQYAWTMPWGETARRALVTENLGYGLYKHATLALMEADPEYDSKARFDEVKESIPVNLWKHASKANSEDELQAILAWGEDEKFSQAVLAHSGVPGAVATGLAAMVDVDMALGFLKGGSVIGPLLQQGTIRATVGTGKRLGSIAYGAGVGLESAVIGEVGNRFLKADYESAGLPAAALSGITFGAGLGAVMPWHKMANERHQEIMSNATLRRQTKADYVEDAIIDPSAPRATDVKPREPEPMEDIDGEVLPRVDVDLDGSVGAARVRGTYGVQLNSATADMTDASIERLNELGWRYDDVPETRAGRIVNQIEDTLNMLPWLRTDQDVLLMSNSPTAQLFGLMSMESSSGRHRVTNNTSAVLRETYLPKLTKNIAVGRDSFNAYTKEVGKKRNADTFREWNRDVAHAMTSRYLDGVDPADLNPRMKEYMDAMDQDFKEALRIMQEADVEAARNIVWTPGWRPHRWSGRKMLDMTELESGRVSNEQLEEGLTNAYLAANKHWTPKVARAVSKSVISRSFSMESGIDTSVISMLQQDGRARLSEVLIQNGLSKKETDAFLQSLTGQLNERGTAKILKHRNEIDPRTQIPGTNYRVQDLMEDDMMAVNLHYARSAAGHAALSKGTNGLIRSKADYDHMKNAIRNEVQVFGGKDVPDNVLDHIWNNFAGGPLNADANVWVKRMVHLSNLSLLNQMGITQVAETGVMIAMTGWDSFMEASAIMRAILKDPSNPKWKAGLAELEEMGIPVQGEHNLLRPDRMLDDYRVTPDLSNVRANDHELMKGLQETFAPGGKFDKLLMQGQRVQGYISGFYLVRYAQTMLFTRAYMQAFGKMMAGTRTLSPERMRDMGFVDDAVFNRIKDNWKHVTYGDLNGRKIVSELNIDKWDKQAVLDFTSIMQRSIGQSIQKGMVGETSAWMSTTAGTILANLRTFTLTGLKKQTLRHARIADPVALASVLYGLPIAGAVYTGRQILNNRSENLSTENIVKGAFSYSNLTAPIPMLSDPFTAILGMDSLQFGTFGARDFSGNYEFVPGMPAVETANRLANMPSSVWALATGQGTPLDVSNAQAVPILGNMLGVNAVFNGIKDSIRAERARERTLERRERHRVQAEARAVEAGAKSSPPEPTQKINPSNVLDELGG